MAKPNISYLETYFEVVTAIMLEFEYGGKSEVVFSRFEAQGRGGLYELAEELTDEFEKLHVGKEWDGEFFDTIESFLKERL